MPKSQLHSRLSRLLVLAICGVLVISSGAAAVTVSTADEQSTPVSITLDDPHTTTHSSGDAVSQVPDVVPNRSLSYANGSNYRFVITDEDHNGTITTSPPITETTNEGVILNNPDPDGTIDGYSSFWIPDVSGGLRDASVTTTGSVATSGVVNLSVALTDAESGDTIAKTQTQPYVLGYVENFTQDGTTGTFEIGVNRSTLPRNTSLTATVFNASAQSDETSDQVELPLEYNSSTDDFMGSVPGDQLAGGNYTIRVEGTLPAPYNTRFEHYGHNVFTVNANSSSDDETTNTSTVNGKMLLPDGSNATNDQITLDEIDGDSGNRTLTDQSGVFTASVLNGSSYDIVYAQSGSASNERTYPIDDVPDVHPVMHQFVNGETNVGTQQLPEANRLNVTVTDANNTPIPNATLYTEIQANDAEGFMQASTDSEGRLVVGDTIGLEANGTVELNVIAPSGTSYTNEYTEVSLTDGDKHVPITLAEPVSVTGNVTNATGMPVDNATVVYDEVNGDINEAVTDANGTYQISIPQGTYDVEFAQSATIGDAKTGFPLDGVPDLLNIERTTIEAEDVNDIALPNAHHLQIRIVDQSNEPLVDTPVSVGHVRDDGQGASIDTRTNDSGYVMLGGTPGLEVNGSVRVDVEGDGYATNIPLIEVTKNETIEVEAKKTVNVTGNVTYNDKTIAAGQYIGARGTTEADLGDSNIITDSGSFKVFVSENGTYDLTFRQLEVDEGETYPKDGNPDLYAFEQFSVETNDKSLGGYTLPAGHDVNITVRGPNGELLPDADVDIQYTPNNSDATVYHNRLATNSAGEVTLEEKSTPGFEIANGTLEVTIRPSGTGILSREETYNITGPLNETIELNASASVNGTVVDANQNRIIGERILVENREDEQYDSTWTDETGNFRIGVAKNATVEMGLIQVPAVGAYNASFERDGIPDVYAFGEYETGTRLDLDTVELPAANVLNLSVVGPNGDPLPNAEVSLWHESAGASAYTELPLTSDGHVGMNGSLGVEVAGNVTVSAERPSGKSNLRNITEELHVTEDRDITLQLPGEYKISGNIQYSENNPAANTTVLATTYEPVPSDSDVTNATGAFTLTGVTNTSTYLGFYQLNNTDPSATVDNRDGFVDMYAIDRLNRSGDYDAGTITVPEGNVVNVSVVNGSTPVPNATVSITQYGSNESIAVLPPLSVGTDGLLNPSATDTPGLELNGSVSIEVNPPAGYTIDDPVKNLTVNRSTNVQFNLNATDADNGGGSDDGDSDDGTNDGGSDDGGDTGDNETDTKTAFVASATLPTTQVTAGDGVTVVANVSNTASTSQTVNVTLQVDGNATKWRNVTMESGEKTQVTFGYSPNVPGTYEIGVNNNTAGTLEVVDDTTGSDGETGTGTPGFGIGAAIAGILAAALIAVRVRD